MDPSPASATARWRRRSDVKMNTEMRTLDDDPDYAEARRQRQQT